MALILRGKETVAGYDTLHKNIFKVLTVIIQSFKPAACACNIKLGPTADSVIDVLMMCRLSYCSFGPLQRLVLLRVGKFVLDTRC